MLSGVIKIITRNAKIKLSATCTPKLCSIPTLIRHKEQDLKQSAMEADAKITEEHRLATAMDIINYEGKTIAVMGTDDGLIMKASLKRHVRFITS